MARSFDAPPTAMMGPPQPDRVPEPSLAADVDFLFARLKHLPDDTLRKRYMQTASTGTVTVEAALAVFGFGRSDLSHWNKGTPPRDLKFTRSLIEVLSGEFSKLKPHAQAGAAEVWASFRSTADPDTADVLRRLPAALGKHRDELWRLGDVAKQAAKAGRTKPGGAAAAATAAAGPSWSADWARRQIELWAEGLTRGQKEQKTRVVVVYGARKSGKGVLINALYERLKASETPPTVLHLNVSNLAALAKADVTQGPTHQRILNRLYEQLCPGQGPWPLPEPHDFDAEMRRVLANAPLGPICLFIGNADACLRLPTAAAVDHATYCTAQLFGSLKPIATPKARSPLDRVSIVVESSRPISELDNAYQKSPFNIAVSYDLGRLNMDECITLATLAGRSTADGERLYAQTGGHRSLVWAALKTDLDHNPNQTLPMDLAALPAVRNTLRILRQELELQPPLLEAFRQVHAGSPIGNDEGSVLRDAMYLVGPAPMACRSPLLEGALLASLIDDGASM